MFTRKSIKALFNKIRVPSDWKDYFSFAAIIFVSIALLCVTIGWILQKNIAKKAQDQTSQEARRIKQEMLYLFDNTKHFMSYLSREVIKNSPKDLLLAWQQVIKSFEAEKGHKIFLWPDFGWIDADNQQIMNTKSGILPTPLDMSSRAYTHLGKKFPGSLQFAKPGPSIPLDAAGAWVIPLGMGITDEHGTFLGMIGAAFRVPDLIKAIEQAVKYKNVEFALFDKKGDLILNSLGRKLNEDQKLLNNLKKIALSNVDQGVAFSTLTFYHKEEIEPFTLVTYLDSPFIDNTRYQTLIPHYVKLLGGGMTCLFLIYFFVQSLIKKNQQLQKAKQDLENAISVAEASDLAKETFLNKIKVELTKPFVRIVTYTDILLKHLKKEINLEFSQTKQMQFLKIIREAAVELKTLSTNVLDLSYVDIIMILEDCIKIHAKQSFMKGIQLVFSIASVPPIYADELRFKQIIVGLLSRAIRFTSKGESIYLSAYTETEGATNFLKIILKDSGYGLTEDEWQKVATRYNPTDCISRCIDGTDLEFPEIERLIGLHQGKCSFEQEWKKGTIVTLLFPYRTPEECKSCKEEGFPTLLREL